MIDELLTNLSSLSLDPSSTNAGQIVQSNLSKLPPSAYNIKSTTSDDSSHLIEQHLSKQFPFSLSQVYTSNLTSLKKLTSGDAKVVYEARLQLPPGTAWEHQPGDSIGVISHNSPRDVDLLCHYVDFRASDLTDASTCFNLEPASQRKPLPDWLSFDRPVSANFLFTHVLQLDVPVSRRLLRILASCCTCDDDKVHKHLLWLSSPEGSHLYVKYIQANSLRLMQLLNSLGTCRFPFTYLLEILPRLQPRYYTLINNQVDSLEFAFTRVDFDCPVTSEEGDVLRRHGLCTGWLESSWMNRSSTASNLPLVSLYRRRNVNNFCLDEQDLNHPVVMIAAGSGIAPFIGFIRQRSSFNKDNANSLSPFWLIYGCRSPLTSLLYGDELKAALDSGVLTNLCLCFSRYSQDSPPSLSKATCVHRQPTRYVQDCIWPEAEGGRGDQNQSNCHLTLFRLVYKEKAKVMVCGDAKGLGKDVKQAWIKLLTNLLPESAIDTSVQKSTTGDAFLKSMQADGRYIEDLWS